MKLKFKVLVEIDMSAFDMSTSIDCVWRFTRGQNQRDGKDERFRRDVSKLSPIATEGNYGK